MSLQEEEEDEYEEQGRGREGGGEGGKWGGWEEDVDELEVGGLEKLWISNNLCSSSQESISITSVVSDSVVNGSIEHDQLGSSPSRNSNEDNASCSLSPKR